MELAECGDNAACDLSADTDSSLVSILLDRFSVLILLDSLKM